MWILPYKDGLNRAYQLIFDLFIHQLFIYVIFLQFFLDSLDVVRIPHITSPWLWDKKTCTSNIENDNTLFISEESERSTFCFEKNECDVFYSTDEFILTNILRNTNGFVNNFSSNNIQTPKKNDRIKIKETRNRKRILVEENNIRYELSNIDRSQTKYYLVGKIRDIIKKKEEKERMQVIYISTEDNIGRTVDDKEECKMCVVRTEIPMYALKVREGLTTENTNDSNNHIYEISKLNTYNRQRKDIKLYYDYEHLYALPSKHKETTKEDLQHLKYILDLLKQPYLMIDFTQRLLLQVPSKYNPQSLWLDKGFIRRKTKKFNKRVPLEKETPLNIERYQHKKTYYSIEHKIGRGSFGEVWSGFSINRKASFDQVVLKRFIIRMKEDLQEEQVGEKTNEEMENTDINDYTKENAEEIARENAMREVYFGELLKNCEHISRFIEYFEEYEIDEHSQEAIRYIWIVFANEGYSLSNHLFESNKNKSGMLQPSNLWWSIKKQGIGMLVMRDLIYQILKGIHEAHEKKITHRDIKMENIFVSSTTPFTVRIGDWGSAVEFDNPHFMFVPKKNEETQGYQPPEYLVGSMKNDFMRKPFYDIWGVGIVFLQFVLGTMNPLEVKNKRNQMKFERKFSKISQQALEEAIFLQSLSELCLTPWVTNEEQLILYPKRKTKTQPNNQTRGKLSGFSVFYIPLIIRRSIQIRKLQLPFQSHLRNKNESAQIVYEIISEKYKSIIPIPHTSDCTDWMCVDTYSTLRNQIYTKFGRRRRRRENKTSIKGKEEKTKKNNLEEQFKKRRNQMLQNTDCNDEHFQNILQQRDPSGIGLPNKNARDLLRKLLDFDYTKRITSKQALQHPWFFE